MKTSQATSLQEISINMKQVSNTCFKKSKNSIKNGYENHEYKHWLIIKKNLKNSIENKTETDEINNPQ